MKRAGVSCDWSRERFTLDPGLSRAVCEAFVRLYEKGLIYQVARITSLTGARAARRRCRIWKWNTKRVTAACGTSAIRWWGWMKISWWRRRVRKRCWAIPGVAINPLCSVLARLHPRNVKLPLTDREIPVVLDDMADPEFGSGAVKITPAHDPNDFEAGKRHDLPSIKVIGEDAKMTAAAGKFAGLDRYEACKQPVAELYEFGFPVKIEPSATVERRQTPLPQDGGGAVGFKASSVDEDEAAGGTGDRGGGRWTHHLCSGELVEDVFLDMDSIPSATGGGFTAGCGGGIGIPEAAAHSGDCAGVTVAREEPANCSKCGSAKLTQETDVLDTWFSSGLWPFSTLGWPDDTADLRAFYPTTLLVTGFDIIFFLGCAYDYVRHGNDGSIKPFRQIHIHGLVRDAGMAGRCRRPRGTWLILWWSTKSTGPMRCALGCWWRRLRGMTSR